MALTHSETIGFFYAFLSVLFFGSFGVPIKTPAVVKAQVDPVVFQCYKTTACFCTSWLALFFVDFKFTWWGVVGAAIWVVNGTVAIIAVQKAGLSVAQALWSGLSIFVGFVWGAYVFAEPIKDVTFSVVALFLMVSSGKAPEAALHHAPETRQCRRISRISFSETVLAV